MKVATVLSIATLALAAPAPSAESNAGTKVAFSRKRHQPMTRDDGTIDMDWLRGKLKYTVKKYNPDFVLDGMLADVMPIVKRDTDAEEKLTDQVEQGADEEYFGTGTVGAAKQSFTFDFDTGSSDTFIPGPKCSAAKGCIGSTRYNQKGHDRGNTTTITYGSGKVTGENYLDSVTIAGLTATNQNVISLTSATGFSQSESDSLMGMAFRTIANSKSAPYFHTLVNEGKVNPPEFSFYLGRAASGTQGKSEMTLGGRDSSKYTGSFTSVPVTKKGYWQVAVADATVAGSKAGSSAGQAAVDTGTTLLIAPMAAAKAIYAKIPGAKALPGASGSSSTLLYGYPCSAKPQVGFTMAGKSFVVNSLDFNLGKYEGTTCVGGVVGSDVFPGESFYILGDVFLKGWYSTFNLGSGGKGPSVSFAKAV